MHSSARGEPPGEPSGSRWESLRGASGGAFGEPLGEPPGSLRGSLWGAGDWPPIVNEKAPCFEDGWKLLWNPVGWCKNMWDVAPLKGFGGRWTPISTAQTKTQRPQPSGMQILEIQTPRRKIPGTKTPRMKIPRTKAPRVQRPADRSRRCGAPTHKADLEVLATNLRLRLRQAPRENLQVAEVSSNGGPAFYQQ